MKVGDTLVERYKLQKEIGRGSSGTVLKATDTLLGTTVCIKILREGLANDEHVIERFKRELLLARRLSHPGICKAFDLQQVDDTTVFLVMEFVEGESLAQRLNRERSPMAPEVAMHIVFGAADAVGVANAQDIVHRDLKPGNILIRDDGSIVVVDFGIATAADMAKLTTPGLVLGSSRYISPERWLGDQALPPSDVWSLGVMLYGCLTARLPFDGEGAFGAFEAMQKGPPDPPTLYNPDIPKKLEQVLKKALAYKVEERYADCSEMADALRAVMDDNTKSFPKPVLPAGLDDDTPKVERPLAKTEKDLDADLSLIPERPALKTEKDIDGRIALGLSRPPATTKKTLELGALAPPRPDSAPTAPAIELAASARTESAEDEAGGEVLSERTAVGFPPSADGDPYTDDGQVSDDTPNPDASPHDDDAPGNDDEEAPKAAIVAPLEPDRTTIELAPAKPESLLSRDTVIGPAPTATDEAASPPTTGDEVLTELGGPQNDLFEDPKTELVREERFTGPDSFEAQLTSNRRRNVIAAMAFIGLVLMTAVIALAWPSEGEKVVTNDAPAKVDATSKPGDDRETDDSDTDDTDDTDDTEDRDTGDTEDSDTEPENTDGDDKGGDDDVVVANKDDDGAADDDTATGFEFDDDDAERMKKPPASAARKSSNTASNKRKRKDDGRTRRRASKKTAKSSAHNGNKKAAADALKRVYAARKKRGLLAGDVPSIDKKIKQLKRLGSSGSQPDQVQSVAQSALADIVKFKIDRALVGRKLTRFNRRYDAVKETSKRKRLDAASAKVSAAFRSGDYTAANKALNKAFALF